MYNLGAESHLGDRVMSIFVFSLSAITWALGYTVIGSAKTHPNGEVGNTVIIFCLPFSLPLLHVGSWRK